jgi:hypothetical protein
MSIIRPTRPFSEVRDHERQVMLFVVASSTVATCASLVVGMLFLLGLSA